MPERKKVFVTGATGFLGSHLTLRLLEEGHHVLALARGSKSASPKDRVEQTLREVADSDEILNSHLAQLEVVEGDISQAGFGMSDDARTLIPSVVETWHCAASLSFAEEDRDEIFQMNVGGTERLLRVVEQTPTRRLHHISTAYVAGNRPDVAMESDNDVGQTFKNAYEESKCRAESMVSLAHQRGTVFATVYRPSIVIGDSKTGKVTHFHGVYAFFRALWTVLERLRRGAPGTGLVHLPLRVSGSTVGTLNFVPIDFVTDALIAIGSQDSGIGRTYHLTNPEATPNALWLPHICQIFQVEGIDLANPEAFEGKPMTKLELMFQKQMAFYYMYLMGEPRFDCRQTQDVLRNTGIECPRVTPEFIDRMAGWYLNYLNHKAD